MARDYIARTAASRRAARLEQQVERVTHVMHNDVGAPHCLDRGAFAPNGGERDAAPEQLSPDLRQLAEGIRRDHTHRQRGGESAQAKLHTGN